MRNPLAVCVLVAVSTATLGPVEASEIAPGTRVRLSVRTDGSGEIRTLRGRVTGSEPGAFTVKPDGEATAVIVRSDQVVRLEQLLKSGRRTKGAIIGASVLGGVMLGLFGWYCSTDWGCDGADSGRVAALVGGSAVLGALIGAGAAPGDRWREIRTVSHPRGGPRLSLVPTRGGGVAASVAIRLPSRR